MGVCSGFAIPVAQQFAAAGKESRMREIVANGTWLSRSFAPVMTVLTVVYCGIIPCAMNTPTDCSLQAYDYIVVIFAGIPFTFLYNLLSGWLRSLGDSKMLLFFLGSPRSSATLIGVHILISSSACSACCWRRGCRVRRFPARSACCSSW